MDDSLKKLLEAEKQAEQIVLEGEKHSDEILRQAHADAHALEQQFIDRIPEMHQLFTDKSHQKAEQTIAELKLRYDERNKELSKLAMEHRGEAAEQALKLILATEGAEDDAVIR